MKSDCPAKVLIDHVSGFSHADILVMMSTLTACQRDIILHDCKCARAKISLGLQMKYTEWDQLPHKLCVLGHTPPPTSQINMGPYTSTFCLPYTCAPAFL